MAQLTHSFLRHWRSGLGELCWRTLIWEIWTQFDVSGSNLQMNNHLTSQPSQILNALLHVIMIFKELLFKLWSLGQQAQHHPWAGQNCRFLGPIQSHPRDWEIGQWHVHLGIPNVQSQHCSLLHNPVCINTVYRGLFLTVKPFTFVW